jgi:phospholipase D1/2
VGRLNRLSRRLARRGVLAIVTVRVVPVAPFTVINLVAGASHIRFRDFLLGSVLGLTPGIFAVAVFTDRLAATVEGPDVTAFVALAAVTAALVAASLALRRWLAQRSPG